MLSLPPGIGEAAPEGATAQRQHDQIGGESFPPSWGKFPITTGVP